MRKVRAVGVVCAAAVAAFLSGCATTEPIWFIATPGYVEAQIATSEAAMRQEYEVQLAEKDRQIARLESEMQAQRRITDEVATLADVITEIESSNRELRGLAQEVELRLDALPRETIQELIEALEHYLETTAVE